MAPFKNIFFGGFQSIKTNKIEKTALSDSAAGISVTVSGQKVFEPGNGYIYHIFTAPGTFVVRYGGYADIFLVGGGGGGGGGPSTVKGGGGGAGGLREEINVFLPIQTYDITIGQGGSGNTGPGVNGTPGGSTTFNRQPVPTGGVPFRTSPSEEITQILVGGGGYGGGPPNANGGAAPLGSGGGGAGNGGDGGLAPSPYGHRGSWGKPAPPYGGGGGGGAYSIAPSDGGDARFGGDGGAGRIAFSGDTGIPTDYGTPGPPDQFGGSGRCFAGGGGGAGQEPQGTYAGQGAYGGGGGDPHYTRTGFNGGIRYDGLENTGGGGMGLYYPLASGNGAPGIVIVRCKVNPT
jgi:hypothetical protein